MAYTQNLITSKYFRTGFWILIIVGLVYYRYTHYKATQEQFTNYQGLGYAPVVDPEKMGEYSDIVLKSPENTNTILPDTPYTLFGTPTSLEDRGTKIDPVFNDNYPSVDGKSSVKSMFIFKNNKCSPGCCPSLFSCDNGCVCDTKEQNDYLDSRGNNHNYQGNDY
jgi:hypothetical protein